MHSESPSPAGSRHVVYLERGRLATGEVISQSSKNYRIVDGAGLSRKLELGKSLAVEDGKEEALEFARAATDLAAGIDMRQVWQAAGGQALKTPELANRCGLPSGPMSSVAMHLAHARHRTFFDVKDCGVWHPISDGKMREVEKALVSRREKLEREQAWQAQLGQGVMPGNLGSCLLEHLNGKGDANSEELRFLKRHCKHEKTSLGELAVRLALVADVDELHMLEVKRELSPDRGGRPKQVDLPTGALLRGAVAVDGSDTVEVDDAFSLAKREDGALDVCVCIAAPALGIDGQAEQQAQERLTTVYLPGRKHTMLPKGVVDHYSLRASGRYPSLVMRAPMSGAGDAAPTFEVAEVGMSANASLEGMEDFGSASWSHPDAQVKRVLEALRTHSLDLRLKSNRHEDRGYMVAVRAGEVVVLPRSNMAVVDDLVAALMVRYNSMAANFLLERDVPFLCKKDGRQFVSKKGGKNGYGWFTSPLRRYVDLCNQRQLLAAIQGKEPPYEAQDLREIGKSFDKKHNWAQNIQRRQEKYWCLRLLQDKMGQQLAGVVTQAGKVLLERMPIVVLVPDRAASKGEKVTVEVQEIDLYNLVAKGELA